MYYELIILGTLMAGPSYGYLIAQIVQNITGPYAKISPGRLYPLLKKLEEAALITASNAAEQPFPTDDRRYQPQSRRYEITEAGRTRFHQLMLDTTSYLGDYEKIFLHKVARFSFLKSAQKVQLVEHYIEYCQSLINYGSARAGELAKMQTGDSVLYSMSPAQLHDLLGAVEHTRSHWQQERHWAETLLKQFTEENLNEL